LDKESHRGKRRAEDSSKAGAALSTNRRHLNDVAVRINRNDGKDAAIWKEDVMNRTIDVDENVPR
jgi:hypothetical protein